MTATQTLPRLWVNAANMDNRSARYPVTTITGTLTCNDVRDDTVRQMPAKQIATQATSKPGRNSIHKPMATVSTVTITPGHATKLPASATQTTAANTAANRTMAAGTVGPAVTLMRGIGFSR